jgi:type VI secretion system secreted protein VgrG
MPRFLSAEAPSGTELLLLRMSGHEELGRLPEFQLEFASPKSGIEPKAVLGKKISWSLELANHERRDFNGFITRFSETGELAASTLEKAPRIGSHRQKTYLYRATVNPWLWFLTRASHSRIWENVTPADVVQQIAGDYAGSLKINLKSEYATRSYIVQYRETDFNFFCRLLEQEGIYFAFEYQGGESTCVLLDSGGLEGFKVPFGQQRRGSTVDYIGAWGKTLEIQPHRYALVDFNYWKPRTPWGGDALIDREHDQAKYEMTDYPGGEFDDALEEGASKDKWLGQYAKARIEELQARYETFSGSGNERRCAPGKIMTLGEHDREQYNADYLITAVSYSASAGDVASTDGGGPDFRCSVSAIGAKTAFRPARITPKPVIQGTQTAIVSDWEEPKSSDLGTGLGRVKVKFHWNQEASSCWVRVAQPLAGNGWGFLGLPRVGDEVVVSFLEGDPDRAIVIGCLYNAESKPPWKLSDERAHTGFKSQSWGAGGFNELRFDDTAGKEEIYIRAQHNKTILIQNDRCETVNKESHLKVLKDVFEDFGAKHHVKVASDQNQDIGGSMSLKVGTDLQVKANSKIAYDAASEIHLKAGSTLVIESGASLSLKVGGNFITIDPSGVSIKGTMVMINTGGSAGSGSGASPAAAEAPKEAHASEGGKENKKPELQKAQASAASPAGGAPPAPPAPAPSPAPSPQAQMFSSAAESGTPFCEICNCPPS